MSRIPTPASIEAAPAAAQALLQGVQKQAGSIPNLLRLLANSPASLDAYLGLSGALARGRLPLQTRERIALAVSEYNRCGYCLSAHTYFARKLAQLDDAEITANRSGVSNDLQAEAAVRFALAVARQRGQASQAQFDAVRAAGYDDEQLLEIVAHVAAAVFSNYVNEVFQTEIDFPLIAVREAA